MIAEEQAEAARRGEAYDPYGSAGGTDGRHPAGELPAGGAPGTPATAGPGPGIRGAAGARQGRADAQAPPPAAPPKALPAPRAPPGYGWATADLHRAAGLLRAVGAFVSAGAVATATPRRRTWATAIRPRSSSPSRGGPVAASSAAACSAAGAGPRGAGPVAREVRAMTADQIVGAILTLLGGCLVVWDRYQASKNHRLVSHAQAEARARRILRGEEPPDDPPPA